VSHTYQPSENLSPELREESARLARSLNDAQPEVRLKVLHAEPQRTFPGMQVYADGTDWNPGSGEGVYVRNAANAAWRYLG
jgi:hypothetical protein